MTQPSFPQQVINQVFGSTDAVWTPLLRSSFEEFDLHAALQTVFGDADGYAVDALIRAYDRGYLDSNQERLFYHSKQHIDISLFILLHVFNRAHSRVLSEHYDLYTRILTIALLFHDVEHTLGFKDDWDNIERAINAFKRFVDDGYVVFGYSTVLFGARDSEPANQFIETVIKLIQASVWPHEDVKDLRPSKIAISVSDLMDILRIVDISTGIIPAGTQLVYRGLFNERWNAASAAAKARCTSDKITPHLPVYKQFLNSQTIFLSQKYTHIQHCIHNNTLAGKYDCLLFVQLWDRLIERHHRYTDEFNRNIPLQNATCRPC